MAKADDLFLAVDGGGTGCRARLCGASGSSLAEAEGGPANIRFGLREAFASVIVDNMSKNGEVAIEILRLAAAHIDAIATRLIALGVPRLSLMGGVAAQVEDMLPTTTRRQIRKTVGGSARRRVVAGPCGRPISCGLK
jgi:glucosamine kinase